MDATVVLLTVNGQWVKGLGGNGSSVCTVSDYTSHEVDDVAPSTEFVLANRNSLQGQCSAKLLCPALHSAEKWLWPGSVSSF